MNLSIQLAHRTLRITIFIGCFVSKTLVFAQARYDVDYKFAKDSITAKPGETFSNTLLLTNRSQKKVILLQNTFTTQFPAGLLALPDTIKLQPGEKRAFPVKYMADKTTIFQRIQPFNLSLVSNDASVKIKPVAGFATKIDNDFALTLELTEPQVYVNQADNRADFTVECINSGLVPLSFKIICPVPNPGLEITCLQQIIELPSSSRKSIAFTARKTDRNNVVNDYRVLLKALDADGRELNTTIIRVECISSNKRYGITNGQFYSMYSNVAGLTYERFSAGFTDYDLWAAGKTNIDSARKLTYSVNLDYYQQQHSIGLYNTFINYQSKDWDIKAGNVFANLDFAINGRGAIGTLNVGDNHSVSLYAVQNEYMLINGLGGSVAGAKTIAADYNFYQSPIENYKIAFIRSNYAYFGLNQSQLYGSFNSEIDDTQYLGFEGGLSIESYRSNSSEPGFSAGFDYHLNGEKYSLSTDVYYSTPYYTGLRRGLMQSIIRLTNRFDDQNAVTVAINIYQSNPNYQYGSQDTVLNNSRQNDLYTGQLSYNLSFDKFNITFGPYLMQQKLNSNYTILQRSNSALWESSAARASVIAGYNAKRSSYSLQADYGYVYSDNTGKILSPFNSLKITGSWTSNFIGFNTYIQLNPYYLTDELSIKNNNRYDQYSGGPSFHFNLLKNKLNLQGSVMYNHYSFSQSDNISANTSAKLTLENSWAITASFLSAQVKQYNVGSVQNAPQGFPSSYYTSQLRVGIEKQFGHAGNSDDKKLELTYFYDMNGNGKRDDGEPAAPNILVSLNDEVAQTDGKGKVKFTDLKKGSYELNIKNSYGWTMEDPIAINIKSSQKLNIPLIKTKAVKGNLIPEGEKYSESIMVLSGVTVTATNTTGKKFETLTGDGGDFCFYLPPDSYTVSVSTKGLYFSVKDNQLSVNTSSGNINPIIFKCKDERRKVTIVKFD